MNKILATLFYNIEVGEGRPLVRLIPLLIVLAGIIGVYNLKVYKGLGDQQSMDNAQLARQIARHQSFTTYFIRPYAMNQIAEYKAKRGQGELYPSAFYPPSVARALPDTYNSPGFPLLLAGLFKVTGPNFDESNEVTGKNRMFSGDRWVPPMNHLFILLTSAVLFALGYRLFDERVAWMAGAVFLFSDFVWKFSLQATPIDLLFLLVALLFWGLVELYRIAEDPFAFEPLPFFRAWLLLPVLAVLLGVIALFSLPLLILAVPIVIYLGCLQRRNWFFLPIFAAIACGITAPWFFHWYRACGNPLGSNLTWGLFGQGEYAGNQIFCNLTIPSYSSVFAAGLAKEYAGFLWYFQRGWDLLGSNPLILLFAASVMHGFRRKRVQAFRLLVVGSGFCIVAMTNLADANPEPSSSWNLCVVLMPLMILIGSAFFFTLMDRFVTQLPLLNIIIVIGTLALCIMPMLLVFTTTTNAYYNYPPYLPPYISFLGRLAPPQQWVTTDMPWATAWYSDHPSLWVPESTADFTHIYDEVNESAFILLTPVTYGKPGSYLTVGEGKEWMSIAYGSNMPPDFPLHRYAKAPGNIDYVIVSNNLGASPGGH